MKLRGALFLIVWFYAFTTQIKNDPKSEGSEDIKREDFQSVYDSLGVQGTTVIYDLNADKYYSNDFE